jgi:uncharacterized protein YbjT (DUF2867 family)
MAATTPIDERDIAVVAVRALFDDAGGAEHMIIGPNSLTQREQVITIGDVIGRTLRFENAWSAAARLGPPTSPRPSPGLRVRVLGQGQLTTDNVIVQRLVATVIRRLSRQTVVPSRWKSRFPAENRVHPPC